VSPVSSFSAIRVGAAQVDITPKADTHLSGAVGLHRPARMVRDPLYAKAVVLERQGRKLCVLSMDLTIITSEYTAEIRKAAAELGFDPASVMVHVVQNHSAPSLGDFMLDRDFEGIAPEDAWLRGSDASYNAYALERAIEAVRQANSSLAPARIGAGSGIEGRMAVNRRAVQRDGTVCMPGPGSAGPLGPTNIRYTEGPIDPEVGVVCAIDDSMSLKAMLLHYSCHPVHVFGSQRDVSADWPGAWADEMRERCGAGCVPAIINGACGNINPWDHYNPDYQNDHKIMGKTLADMAENVIRTLEFKDDCELDWRLDKIRIPLRELDPERLEWARDILARHPEPLWTDDTHTQTDYDWIMAAQMWSVQLCKNRDSHLEYEIQVLRIGDIAIVGLPGEPFVEGQLRIKIASPTYPTYVAHCTSQYVGYLPTLEAFARGGHEVVTTHWSKLAPQALDMVVDGATECLNAVFAGDKTTDQ